MIKILKNKKFKINYKYRKFKKLQMKITLKYWNIQKNFFNKLPKRKMNIHIYKIQIINQNYSQNHKNFVLEITQLI
jgi:hypothetical protein